MFFQRAVGGAFLHELHGLATADEFGAAAVQNFDNIAAMGAFINFQLIGHNIPHYVIKNYEGIGLSEPGCPARKRGGFANTPAGRTRWKAFRRYGRADCANLPFTDILIKILD